MNSDAVLINRESAFYSEIFNQLLQAKNKAGFHLSFQDNDEYTDLENCTIFFNKFSIIYNPKKPSLNELLHVEIPDQMIFKEQLEKKIFENGRLLLPGNTRQMPVLNKINPIMNIKTPSISSNGVLFYPYREHLKIPASDFYFKINSGFGNSSYFPNAYVNHFYNNGSVLIFGVFENKYWDESKIQEFIQIVRDLEPFETRILRYKKGNANLSVIIENSVGKEIDRFFLKMFQQWSLEK